MTTILVTEDNKMYSDSQGTSGDFIISNNMDKIECINGHLVGAAGRFSSCLAFKGWYEGVCESLEAKRQYPNSQVVLPESDDKDDGSFNALVLSPDGTLTLFEANHIAYEVTKPYAIGSGAIYALCALDTGADGLTAMEVAIKRDVFSGGEIQMLELVDEEEENGEA